MDIRARLKEHLENWCDECMDILTSGVFDGLGDHLADVLEAPPGNVYAPKNEISDRFYPR